MAKFVYLYSGGSMAETPEEQATVMQQWTAWFTELGASIADPGAPFGASTGVSGLSGTTGSDSLGATGYSVVVADSLDGAVTAAKGCPVLASGGAVDVYQLIEM